MPSFKQALFAVFFLLVGLAEPLAAFPRALFEREPNDTVDQARTFRGEARLIGNVHRDDVDMFRWAFDDDEANRYWTIELRAARPDSGIRLRLIWPAEETGGVFEFGREPADTVADAETELLSLTLPAGTLQAGHRRLIMPPGEQIIVIETDGSGGDYEVILSSTDHVRGVQSLASGETPQAPPRPGQLVVYQVSDASLGLPLLPDSGEGSRWQVQLVAELGAPLSARLEGLGGIHDPMEVHGLVAEQSWSRLTLDEASRLHVERADGQPLGRIGLRLSDDGPRDVSADASSSSSQDAPRWIELDQTISVSLQGRGPGTLAFELDEDQAAAGMNIELVGEIPAPVSVCLIERDVRRPYCSRGELAGAASVCEEPSPGARDPVCRQADSGVVFAGIQLDAGSYEIRLENSRRSEPLELALTLRAVNARGPGQARQPNDHAHWSVPLLPNAPLAGELVGSRSAFFNVVIPADQPYWTLQAEGDKLNALRVGRWRQLRGAGQARQAGGLVADAASNQGAPALAHQRLNLAPGRYLIELVGEDTDYRLMLQAAEPPPPGTEREPNDEPRTANPVFPGTSIRGHFHSPADHDWFHFHLPGWNRVNLGIEPPDDGDIRLRLYNGDDRLLQTVALDEPTALSAFLPAGDYYLALHSQQHSTAPYKIDFALDAPWHHAAPAHPAPFWRHAGPLPDSGHVDRIVGGVEHSLGYFSLPAGDSDRIVGVQHAPGLYEARFFDKEGKRLECRETSSRNNCELKVPPGQPIVVETRQTVRINRAIVIDDPLPGVKVDSAPVNLSLDSVADAVAAAQVLRQRVPVRVTIESSEPHAALPLAWHLSHRDAQVLGLPETVALSDQALALEFEVDLPARLNPDLPLSLFVRAGQDHARIDWSVSADQSVLGGLEETFPPPQLAGLVNLAWGALGATFIDPETGDPAPSRLREGGNDHYIGLTQLIDDMATLGSYLRWHRPLGEPLPPLRLALGGGQVHALTFNSLSGHPLAARWAQLDIAFADETLQFSEPISVTLEPFSGEQLFELPEPIFARYVQITPRRSWSDSQPTGLGLMRVLGEPASSGAPADVLAPDLGGHVVWTDPPLDEQLRTLHRADELPDLLASARPLPIRGQTQTLVYGMNQNRAAQVSGLGWQERLDGQGQPVESLRVLTSTAGPAGPWEDRGDWTLSRDSSGQASFDFDQPIWTRYIRLDIHLPDPEAPDQPATWNLPAAVSAFESRPLSSRESILAWWGHDAMTGPFERLVEQEQRFWPVADDRSQPERPHRLRDSVIGEVAAPGDTRSYHIEVSDGENSVLVSVAEDQPGRTDLRLFGPDGEAVEVPVDRPRSGEVILSAVGLTPGTYRLDVIHLPRNIVFIWDGSGSVAEHQPVIYQALNRFAQGLAPDQERANLIPLAGPLLIRDWADRPDQIRRTLAEYDNRFAGSDSEPALAQAVRAQAQEAGESVIFLITDAELVSRDLSVWNGLSETRPRIFALEINHGNDSGTNTHRHYQQLMQNWAMVGGGQYHYTTDRSSLVQAFEAGMRQIRQPGRFQLSAETSYQEPPRPGSLQIVSGDAPAVGGAVVQLIFDASGSMLRRMEGGRRIDVARRIVLEMLDERIPESVPVALRAYGHTEPHSCETELLVSPSAGSHGQARTAIETIQAINLARTPLAASVEAVIEDLRGFEDQNRLVILLTDGEETCDGDLEQAVERLVASGVNVRLNIVGFHIDELDLQGDFDRFAAMGRGAYFDSQDSEELIGGLRRALSPTFQVLDSRGVELAAGRVDDEAITLEPGTYEIRLQDDSGERVRQVRIAPEQAKVLRLDGAF